MSVSMYGRELIDEADNKRDAQKLVREYQSAFGPDFSIYIKYKGKILQ